MDIINEVWSNWYIDEFLGEGSFGKVYRVFREDLGHRSYSAVKVIRLPQNKSEIDELTSSGMNEQSISTYYEGMVRQLMDEIKIMQSLKSANNIVTIEDFQLIPEEDGIGWNVFIRMELLTSLNDYIKSQSLTLEDIIHLGMDICEALRACEEAQIIHRDIKVENIFVNAFGRFKLGDFGIARQLEKVQSAMSKKGTSMYMSPEVYKGEEYGSSVDLYSLGIVMYRFLNKGKYPFMPLSQTINFGDREEALLKRIQGEKIPNPVDADEQLSDIIQKACAYIPEERYQSAEEMYIELKQYKELLANNKLKKVISAVGNDSNKINFQYVKK